VRKLIEEEAMGDDDVFYGNDDHREMNDDGMYKEDVIESMRKELESKDLKRRRKNRCYSFFLSCLEFFTLLRGFINF